MSYYLMTGATGLLGRYLVRDLLDAGFSLAVLVRPARLQSASDRIEAVMSHWEQLAGRVLPRPVVLEGTLHEPGLGLSDQTRNWVARNCTAVIHSAAAMMFRPDEHGEPFRTNVHGLGNLMGFCRHTGLRRFHHVSTAYVCGLREGRVRETELDLGQSLGNVYEESKLRAETLLRDADCFDVLTIYRPASIIGDSRTGYTTTYHGFYLPLQLAYSFAAAIPPSLMNERFSSRLGLTGTEGKNFVPVDWVSAAITHVVSHPELHGRTYHLASPKPVSVRLFQSVIQEAVERYSGRSLPSYVDEKELALYERLFHDQMLIYRSHWRDDPQFDLTWSGKALEHLPCPEMDHDLLLRVARYPVENHFSLPRYSPSAVDLHVQQHLERFLRQPSDECEGTEVAMAVDGPGGGQWHLLTRGRTILGAGLGLGLRPTAGFHLGAETFAAMVRGQCTVEQSIDSGRVVIHGRRATHGDLVNILQQVVASA
jgi:thioester reductase-like protein